jgi:putative oxidoreductase
MNTAAISPAPAFSSANPSAKASSYAALAGRVLIAPLFLLSGISKVDAPAATIGMIESASLPFASVGFGLAVLVEIVGGVALLAGYRTRLVATVMALFTLGAAVAFHNNLADQNQFIHFFKNISIIGGLLQIVAFGAGRFSLDGKTNG